MKTIALSALVAGISAIHHHHHHHPAANTLLMDDPNCTTSQDTGHCLVSHYKDEFKPDKNKDYFVPNFGQDDDIRATLKFAGEAEVDLDHQWIPYTGKPKPGPPKDYFVPNFGVDSDIVGMQQNLAVAEAQLKHKLVIPKTTAVRENEDVPPAQQPENRFLDYDVQTTLKNSAAAEESTGHKWNIVWN